MAKRNRKLVESLIGKPCIFCCGSKQSDSIEHAPPVVLFLGRDRPRGLEFSACKRCNLGSSQRDQVAACLAIIARDAASNENHGEEIAKLLRAINRNNPEVLQYFEDTGKSDEVTISVNGRESVRYLVPMNRRVFRDWLNPWAAKQACALWFQETDAIIDQNQRILITWIMPDEFHRVGVHEKILETLPTYESMKMGKRDYSNQFAYHFAVNSKENLGGFFVILQNSVAFIALILPNSDISRLKSEIKLGNLFRVSSAAGIEKCLGAPFAEVEG